MPGAIRKGVAVADADETLIAGHLASWRGATVEP
jgi:hypothetical protein